MSNMSRTMNLPQISKILQDFERESSAMDMKEEMMSDTIDDVMEDEGETEEEESDAILKQVLDEIGVSMNQQVSEQGEASAKPKPSRASQTSAERDEALTSTRLSCSCPTHRRASESHKLRPNSGAPSQWASQVAGRLTQIQRWTSYRPGWTS